MRVFLISLLVGLLSLGAFALEEAITLRFLIVNSKDHFSKNKKDIERKLRGLGEISKMSGLNQTQKAVLAKSKTYQSCRKDAYGMLLDIAGLFEKEDALSSAFLTRRKLNIKGDHMLSLYDFFIRPYLEYLNYKTEFLTSAVNRTSFRTNEAMPFFVNELNVDGYCERDADLRHYGEDGDYKEMELTLPEAIAINDVDRSKLKIVDLEIEKLESYARSAQAK